LEIAKLRAARVLCQQVLEAFGVQPREQPPMRLHARTSLLTASRFDPFTNLLRATTGAMSAALGGADTISVEAFGYDTHLAENVPRVLDHEAHLAAVTDPAAGSWFVESLTDSLAREAWTLLQEIERAGGFAAAVESGDIARAVEAARAAKAEALAVRRWTLVGVNDYPDPDERSIADPGRIPEIARLAEPFEEIRLRTLRHVDDTGRRPLVQLVARGDAGTRMARVNFCRNLFGVAGFAIEQVDRPTDAADLVVLCAPDADYPALVEEIRHATRAPILVAGRPPEADALRDAGVQDFLYQGIDVVQTLRRWQERVGI
ncbi:MAG TPA: methylmalonyl-CoA mutase family protein, partial [Vicinamibacterales bacterium]